VEQQGQVDVRPEAMRLARAAQSFERPGDEVGVSAVTGDRERKSLGLSQDAAGDAVVDRYVARALSP